MKKRVLVIAPGRGTYNKDELGYFKKYHSDKTDLISRIDEYRRDKGQVTVSELDSADKFIMKEHTKGDNASPLIYACAYADFLSINRDEYEIIAVTGNSMGWYIALACGGAVDVYGGMDVINTMGTFMQDALIGGQLIYTCVDDDWQVISEVKDDVLKLCNEIDNLYPSIFLGGMFVFGGDEKALKTLETKLEKRDRFPFRLINHAAFHTPLQNPISEKALGHFSPSIFKNPDIPMIDGRGKIWSPYSTDINALHEYTFGHQVTQSYDFSSAVQVSVKEHAPDNIIVLGPGTTLGGAVAQSLIDIEWEGLRSKSDFIKRQTEDPYILSMGMDDQRKRVTV